MASGCAVVASRCGGFPEIITHGENGLLSSPGDPGELSRQLYELLTTQGMIADLGAAARKTVQKVYDTPVACKKAEQWYQSVRDLRRQPTKGTA
jgi:glycosyltransferase involved in cell wall biosynthesis